MSGRLGKADLSANTNTIVFTAAIDKVSTINVNFCNRNSTAVQVRLAIEDGSTGVPSASDYIEYGVTVPANDVLERTGIVLSPGNSVIAFSSSAQVSVNVWGFES